MASLQDHQVSNSSSSSSSNSLASYQSQLQLDLVQISNKSYLPPHQLTNKPNQKAYQSLLQKLLPHPLRKPLLHQLLQSHLPMRSKLPLNNHLLLKVPLLPLSQNLFPRPQRTMVVFSLQFHWQVPQLQKPHFNLNLAMSLLHLRLNRLQRV
jgi:hypothetical protein